jgi:O-antigen/teichoic acid export membrane protein
MQNNLLKRVLSGSIANWCGIILGFAAQIITVPVFLIKWNSQIYGQWLALLSFFTFIQLIDTAHQTYIGNKVLKIGADNINQLKRTLFSAVVVSVPFGLLQVFIFVFLFNLTNFKSFLISQFSFDPVFINNIGTLIVAHSVMWSIFGSAGGMLVRGLSPFGYYHRMAWWGVYIQSVTIFIPAITLLLGFSFLQVGLSLIIATALVNVHLSFEFYKLYSGLGIRFDSWSFKLGWHNFKKSQFIIYRNILEIFRIQGLRLILAPLSGVSSLATFVTIRTGANVALQGLSTITNPLMPELMRFLNRRDQIRSETVFGTVWVVVVFILAPFVVILQSFIEPLFLIWTHGKISFDPLLFAILSLGVLVYAVAQPAMAIVNGNNLLKSQLFLSLIATSVVICGIFISVSSLGLVGVGLSLLGAEVVSAVGYIIIARHWLNQNGLFWPKRPAFFVVLSILIAGSSMCLIILLPTFKLLVLGCSMILLFGNGMRYWKLLPSFAIQRVKAIIHNFTYLFH